MHQNLQQKAIFIKEFITKVVSQLHISTTIQDLQNDFKLQIKNYNTALHDLFNIIKKHQIIKDSSYTTDELIQLISNSDEPTPNVPSTSTRPTFTSKRKCDSPKINSKKKKMYSLTPLQNYIYKNIK